MPLAFALAGVLSVRAQAAEPPPDPPLTRGQKNILAISDPRSAAEKAGRLRELQAEIQAMDAEARPLIKRLGEPAEGGSGEDGKTASPRADLRARLLELGRRERRLDQEYSILKRSYEFDLQAAALRGALKGRRSGPAPKDLADLRALEAFHESLKEFRRDLVETLAKEDSAHEAALLRERDRRRDRVEMLAAAGLVGGILLLVFLARRRAPSSRALESAGK